MAQPWEVDWSKQGAGKADDDSTPPWERKWGAAPAKKPEAAKTRNPAAFLNDTVIEAGNAVAGAVKSVGDFLAPGNRVSEFIDTNIIKAGEANQSDAVKAEKAKYRAEMEGAEGIGDEIGATLGYVVRNPIQSLAQAAGSFAVPGAAVKAGGMLGSVAGLGVQGATRTGLAGGAVAGAALSGGDAAGTAYELVKRAGGSDKEATEAARRASVLPAAIGAAGGVIGAERLLAGAGGFKGGALSRALTTAGVEGAQEAVEEGVTQYEGRRAAVPFDPSIDPLKGVAGAATMGAVLGGATGAGVSLLHGKPAEQKKDAGDILAAPTVDAAISNAMLAIAGPVAKPAWEVVDGLALPGPAQPEAPTMLRSLPAPDGQPVYMADERGNVAPQPAEARTEALNRQFEAGQQAEAAARATDALGITPGLRRAQQQRELRDAEGNLIPVGEATELPNIPTGDATELEPIPAGEAAELVPTPDATELEPIPAGEATELEVQTIEPGDLMAKDGEPFVSKTGAQARAFSAGGRVVSIPDHFGSGKPGYVVRPITEVRPNNTRGTNAADAIRVGGAPTADAGRGNGVAGVPDSRPADVLAGAASPAGQGVAGAGAAGNGRVQRDALTPGQRVTLPNKDGAREVWTVDGQTGNILRLDNGKGRMRAVQVGSPTWDAIQPEGGAATDQATNQNGVSETAGGQPLAGTLQPTPQADAKPTPEPTRVEAPASATAAATEPAAAAARPASLEADGLTTEPSGGPELEAAGFKNTPSMPNGWGRTVMDGPNVKHLFGVREFGTPKKYRVTRSTSFPGTSMTGAPTLELGTFSTPGQALAAVQSDLEKRMPGRAPAVATPNAEASAQAATRGAEAAPAAPAPSDVSTSAPNLNTSQERVQKAPESEQVARNPKAQAVKEELAGKKGGRTLQEQVERPAPADDGVVASTGPADAEGERKFYVTMVRGDRVARLAGPFDTKAEADAMLPRAQDEANKADPRSAFDAFGVSGITSTNHKPGTLNDRLGIGADAPASAPQPEAEAPALAAAPDELPNPWEISQDEFIRRTTFTKEGSTAFPWVAKWGDRILEAENEVFDHPDLGKTVVQGGRFSKTKREAEAKARGAHKRAVRRGVLNGYTATPEALAAYPDLQPAKPAAPAEAPKAEQAPAEQAAAILNAAAEPPKGKERLDVLKDVKAGAITPEEVAAAYPAAEQAKAPASPVEADAALWAKVTDGNATPDEFKAGFEAWVNNKAAILAELSGKTKAELMKMGGAWFTSRYKGDTKPEIAEALWRQGASAYTLGRSFQYGMGKEAYTNSIRRMVEATDADQLAQYVADRKAAQEEAMARVAKVAEAIKDPKTLSDYQTWMRATMEGGKSFKEARMMLTPEQRAAYDDLAAESSRGSRKARADDDRTTVRAAGQSTAGIIIATKHTRDGHDLWVVKLADRVGKDDYTTLLNGAKRLGGNYSSFRGNGAVPGFQFRTPEAAQAFLKLAGGDTAAATEVAKERRNAFEDDRSQTATERLTEMADRLEERADESLSRDRKANTDRRARFAASAEAAARADKAMAKTMRNIASAIGQGGAKFLDRVRQKVQVELLQTYVANGNDAMLRAKYPTYAEQERHKGEAPTIEAADYAEFPQFTAYRSDLASLGRQLLEVDGTKKLGERIMKVADDVSDAFTAFAKEPGNLFRLSTFSVRAGDEVRTAIFPTREGAERAITRSGLSGKAIVFPEKRGVNRIIMSPSEAMARGIWKGDGDKQITLTEDFGNELVEKIGRVARRGAKVSVPWQFERTYDRRKQLDRMGIETPAEFRAALREFIAMREQPAEADKIKAMERAMIGRRNDGLDFFPTPESVADEMVAAADIQPGMRVLEPSAGMGHIAERIRSTEVDPDVVEFSNDRAELLEAKGFSVVGRDFMEVKEGGYDRILMNPPFSDSRDIQHVRHAYDLLKPGGRLVAIMGESAFFNQNKRATEFREWLESVGGSDEKLPEGTFNDPSLPVNTGANARMVVIEKPTGASNESGSVRDDDVGYAGRGMGGSGEAALRERAPGSEGEGGEGARFSRAPAGRTATMTVPQVQGIVANIKAAWRNAPNVVVVESLSGPDVPERVREAEKAAAMNGAGVGRGVILGDTVYLAAGAMATDAMVAETLFHEALGHYGLRGMFGKDLDTILGQLAKTLPEKVTAKAIEYGLNPLEQADRLTAAEEVLAEIAQTRPTSTWVQRAIAAIRTWLRTNIPGFADMALNEAEVIRNFIMPARAFVERGRLAAMRDMPAFSRGPAEANTDTSDAGVANFVRRGTADAARAAGFTMKAYRGVSASSPFNDTGTTWLTTSREVAEAYAEEVMGYDDPAVLEVMVKPDSLPRHDASRLTDVQREAMGADEFGNPQAVGIYDRSDDHPLGGSRRGVTVIHAPKDAVWLVDEDAAFSRAADQTQTSAFKRWFGDNAVSGARTVSARDAARAKGRMDGRASDTKAIPDLLVSQSFRTKGLGGLEAPAQRRVLDGVRGVGQDLQVARRVVELLPIAVVDILGGKQRAAENLFGNDSMLQQFLSIDGDGSVSTAVDIADALVAAVASVAAELPGANTRMLGAGGERRSTMRADVVIGAHTSIVNQDYTGNSGAFDPGTADIRFSRAPSASAAPEWITSGSAALQGAAGKIDTYAPTKTIAEKVSEMSAGWKQKLVQGMFDAYAPLKALSMDAYIAARMTKAADGAFEGMLMYGKPVMTADGGITGDLDGKGFLGAMRELNGEHDRFFMWLAGNRAERLMSEGKENLFTADEIAAMKALNGGTTPDGRPRTIAFKRALDEFNAYSKAVLDVAEKAGLIDGESRKLWEHDFYVPFYRMSQENEISGPTKIKGLVRQKAFERLKGGKDNLGDLMDNTLRNWSHLLSASLANVAASKSLLAAERAGIAIEAREAQAKEIAKAAGLKGNATYFMDQGLQRWFVVEDPAVLQAISAMEAPALNGLPLQIMAKFKKYLTVGVTIAPAFKVRNLIRDTLAAPAANEMSFNIAKNLSQGWKATDTKTSGYAQMLFSGGLMRFGTYLEGDRAEHVKRLIADGVDDKTILNTPQKVKAMLGKAWDAWQDFGDRMENVNRTALYQQLLDKGMTPREAAFQARDMMDFSLQGSWAAMRTLTAVVPFLNARAQGLYKLGRAAGENPKRMGYMVAAVSLASIALMLAYQDDDDWKAREDWDRDAWWWFKIGETAYRIPKPFEVGAMGTIAERSLELVISDEMTGARFAERMKQMVTGTFAINPVPQMFKPMLDLYANKDSFTGRQIETLGMERLSKPERYGPNTSALARALGSAGDYTGVSPVQVDHMIRAYFGWLGTMGAATVDAATSPFSEIEKPAKKMDDYFGGFVKELPAASSRYLEDFYEQAKATSEAMADLRRAREAGDTEKAAEIMEERGDKVAQYRVYQQAQQQLAGLNKRIRIVRSSTELDADTKRLRLDELTELRNRIARQVSDRTRAREAALQ